MDVITLEVPKESRLAKVKKAKAHHLSSIGLIVSAVAIGPVIAFAFLWASLLLILGGMWVASSLGII